MDFPPTEVPPRYLHTWSWQSGVYEGQINTNAGLVPASITWVAKIAVCVPMTLPWPYTVRRVFWGTGSAASGSNTDFGIYTAGGTLVYSTGLTANANSELKYVTPTAFTLSPGQYFFALSNDGTTNTCYGTTGIATSSMRLCGFLRQDLTGGTGALPATATFSAITGAYSPFCGVTSTTTA